MLRFNRIIACLLLKIVFESVTRSGSPKDRTWQNPVISRVWATSPRLPFKLFVVSSVRTGSAVVREAFESSSPGLQPGALPLELPNHFFSRRVLVCPMQRSFDPNPKKARGQLTRALKRIRCLAKRLQAQR